MSDQAIRVLLVEDSPSDALLIEQELAETPGLYHLTHVERVDEALANLRKQQFDAVLTDLNLPDSSGFNSFQRLQAESPDLPIVVLTGSDDEAAGIEAIRLGAQDYLTKGKTTGSAIARVIRYSIERKATAMALRESEERLRILGDNLPDSAVYQFTYDSDGTPRFLYFSAGVERMNGVGVAEVLRDAGTLLGQIPREYREPMFEAEKRSARELSDFDAEIPMRRPDGQLRWMRLHSRPRRMPDGRVVWDGVQADISKRKSTEAALRESEARFRAFFETVSVGTAQMDMDGRFVEVNDRYCEISGFSREEMLHITPDDLAHPDDRERDRVQMAAYLRGDIPAFESEKRYVRKDGEMVWVQVSAALIRDAEGRPLYSAGVIQDITIRKRTENTLQQSEQRLVSAIAIAQLSIWEYDGGRGIIKFDPRCSEIFGLGDQSSMTVDEFLACIHPEDHNRVAADVRDALDPAGAGLYETEYRIVRHDGTQRWVAARGHAIFVGEGEARRVSQFVGTLMDITAHKRAEEALRQAKEQAERQAAELATVLNSMEDLVLIFDKDKSLLRTNDAAKHFGQSEMTGLPWDKHAPVFERLKTRHPDGRKFEQEDRPLVQALQGHPVCDQQTIITYFDGTERWFSTSCAPLIVGGEIQGAVTVSRDITDSKRSEEALRKAKDELELRVEERTAELSERAQQLRLLASELTMAEQRERKRLAQLLHDGLQQILVSSRMRLAKLTTANNQEVRQRATEVSELLSESIELSRSLTAQLSPPILHEGGLVPALEWLVRWELDKQGLEVELEARAQLEPAAEELNILLFQATRELLFNTVKHSGVKTARVQVAQREEMIEVTVSDEGAGFDPAQLLKRDGKSGGFGLFNIRERLELQGGAMEIHSAPGSGSRFVLLAPLPESAEAPTGTLKQPRKVSVAFATSHEAAADDGHSAKKIRVMLVDDHLVMRQGLGFLIREEHDLEVVGEASDGDAAIRLAREVHPDVILMDVSMSGMNGPEATRIIHAEMPEIQIIGLSMFEETERAETMREAGAVNYLTKSGPSEKLIVAIRACARERLLD